MDDAHNGLCLCPCNINPGNFKEGPDGKVVALDFGATCFLPPSFFTIAMAKAEDNYLKSDDIEAIVSTSYFMVPFRTSNMGQPDSFSFHLD